MSNFANSLINYTNAKLNGSAFINAVLNSVIGFSGFNYREVEGDLDSEIRFTTKPLFQKAVVGNAVVIVNPVLQKVFILRGSDDKSVSNADLVRLLQKDTGIPLYLNILAAAVHGYTFEVNIGAETVIPRTGCFVLFGEARSGKTVLMKRLGSPVYTVGEPVVNALGLREFDATLKVVAALNVLCKVNAIKYEVLSFCVDSYRELLYTASGATLPKGVNSGFFLELKELASLFEAADIGCLLSVNPMEMIDTGSNDTEDPFTTPGILRACVGSSSGVLTDIRLSETEDGVNMVRASLRREFNRQVVTLELSSQLPFFVTNANPSTEESGDIDDDGISVTEDDVIVFTDTIDAKGDEDRIFGRENYLKG